MQLVQFFDAYVGFGLRPVPLYPRSKIPVGKGWNTSWDAQAIRKNFQRFPKSNMGILLGDVVDVEGDTAEANDILLELVGDSPHPMYRSSKSTHHLFKNPDPKLTAVRFNNIEFRAYKHQSVLPPSFHEDGSKYFWLASTKFPIPDMPEELLRYYQINVQKRPNIKPGHCRPWCSVCRKRCFIHRKRFLLEKEALASFGYPWQCHDCREFDVRDLCRKLRKVTRAGNNALVSEALLDG